MIKKILLVLALSFSIKNAHAQYIKLDNGILFSSLQNNKDLPLLTKNIQQYSILLGTDYFEKKWFYLSSQVGYTKFGGKENYPGLQPESSKVSEMKSYAHLNTTFRAFLENSGLKGFVGIGPYANVLAADRDFSSDLLGPFYKFKRINAGGKGEIGLTYDVSKLRIGLVGSYMLGLSPAASTEFISLYNHAYSVSLTVGYKLR